MFWKLKFSLSEISGLAKDRKELIRETEALKAKRNSVTQEIAQLKAKSKSDPEAAKLADQKVLEMRGCRPANMTQDERCEYQYAGTLEKWVTLHKAICCRHGVDQQPGVSRRKQLPR